MTSTKRTPTLPFAAGSNEAPGARPPPRPDLPLIIARLVLLACVLLLLARGPLLALAERVPPPSKPLSTSPAVPRPKGTFAPWGWVPQAAAQMRAVLTSPAMAIPRLGALIGLSGLGVELLVAAALLVLQTSRQRQVRSTYARLRTPQPLARGQTGHTAQASADLYHALHQALPSAAGPTGAQPWLALTIGARPDEPAEFGVVLSGGTDAERASRLATVRKVVSGLEAGALIDERPDPLAEAARTGSLLLWREYTLRLPPAYPLRRPADAGSDLLAPLVTALRGRRGVVYTEYQLTLRPRDDFDLTGGWRVYALRRLLQLRARRSYALAPDQAALQDKLAEPAYDLSLRVVALAADPAHRATAQAELDAVERVLLGQFQARSGTRVQRFRQADGRTVALRSWLSQSRWRRILARAPRATPLGPLIWPWRLWAGPSSVSAGELAGLWHLPSAAMGAHAAWLPCRVLPAPPQAFVPEPPIVSPPQALGWLWRWRNRAAGNESSVAPPAREPTLTLGHALRSDGAFAPVGLALTALRKILHITAGMGAGKTRLLANLCRQLFPVGLILGDGKGDDDQGSLVAVVRGLLPLEDEGRLALLDVLDTEWPVGINPLAGIDLARPGGVDLALGQVLAIFGRLDPEVWAKSMGMQQFIRMGALLVLEGEPLPTMAQIKQALVDERYRSALLQRCTNIEVQTFWTLTFPQTSDPQRVSLEALLRRFDNLLATETTRYLLTQPLATFDFRAAIDGRAIVLVPMPDLTLGGIAGLVGMLTLQAIVRAAFQRRGSDQTRATCPLIFDEFQVILAQGATEDVSTAVTRLRSLGIGGVYAHQSLAQLGDLRDTILINAASRIILKTLEPDASIYARQYAASGLTAVDIANQDASEHQYAVLDCDGQTLGPLSLRPMPWPQPETPTVVKESGPDWQTLAPQPEEPTDRLILRLVYGAWDARHLQRLVGELARLGAEEWEYLGERWSAIAAAQRAHILARPGCIPDRLERQRWLSRLWVARPRVLVAAAYQRQRWTVAPDEPPARVAPGQRRIGRSDSPPAAPDPTATWKYSVSYAHDQAS